jgi:hypothetical protein
MFKILNRSDMAEYQTFSVMVGGGQDRKTNALWYVPTVQDVIDTLCLIVDA